MNQQFGNQIGQFGNQGGFNQGFTQGAGQQQLNAQVQRIQQATISGQESNPLRGAGFAGGFGSTGMLNQGNFTSSGASANFGNAQGGFGQAVSQQQLNRIHQNSIFNGASQLDNAQIQRIQQATISGEEPNPLSPAFGGGFAQNNFGGGFSNAQANFGQAQAGFGAAGNLVNQGNFGSGASANFGNAQGGFGQGVSQQQLNQIHQNSIFNGASQPDNAQIQRIQQATISGEEPNPLSPAFGGGFAQNNFGGGFSNAQAGFGATGALANQGNFASGQSANFGNAQAGFGTAQAGFGAAGNLVNQGNFGSGQSANFGNQQGGFGQGVSQQQLNQIHQNSIFNGASQPDNAQIQRIQQATISGEEPNPLSPAFGGGFGGGFAQSNFGGGFGQAQAGFGAAGNLVNQGNFGSGASANFGNAQGGFNQAISQQQLNQIHQNSIFNGASQPDNAQVQRIQQATISGEETNPLRGSFGGASMGMMGGQQGMMSMMGAQGQGRQGGQSQGFVNPSALNAVLNADAGILDQQGPNRYPAAMFTGSNQYDNVNQSVLNQLTRNF